MSREYYSKEDIIEIYLAEDRKFKMALSYKYGTKEPLFFDATFLSYNYQSGVLNYRAFGAWKKTIQLSEVLQIETDLQSSSLPQTQTF